MRIHLFLGYIIIFREFPVTLYKFLTRRDAKECTHKDKVMVVGGKEVTVAGIMDTEVGNEVMVAGIMDTGVGTEVMDIKKSS